MRACGSANLARIASVSRLISSGIFADACSHCIFVAFKAFHFRIIKKHRLDIGRIFEFGLDRFLQFGENGFDILGFFFGASAERSMNGRFTLSLTRASKDSASRPMNWG